MKKYLQNIILCGRLHSKKGKANLIISRSYYRMRVIILSYTGSKNFPAEKNYIYVPECREKVTLFTNLCFLLHLWNRKELLLSEKDVSEMMLEDYNDVFSDIVNVLIFNGQNVVRDNELTTLHPASIFNSNDGKLHKQERDVIKRWKRGMINLAMLGFENQTSKALDIMPIRVIGYDGSAYRAQLSEYDAEVRRWAQGHKPENKGKDHIESGQGEFFSEISDRPKFHPVPVITIVLYFGLDHWDKKLRLKDLFDLPAILDPYVNDYKITVFEVAWLSDEQINAFKSDFQIIARFLSKKRKKEDYDLRDTKEFIHAAETLNLLSVLTGDALYTYADTAEMNKRYGGEPKNMCEYIQRIWNNGISEGIEQGINQGIALRDKQKIEEMLKSGKTPQEISEFCLYPLELVLNVKETMVVA